MKTWASIISDLQQSGMTYAEIGSEIGVAGSTIGDLASGRSKSPRGDAAIKLHALHARLSPEAHPPKRRAAAEGAAATNEDSVSVKDAA